VTVGNGGILSMPRTDGIYDGYNVIQGVRTYDPNTSTWTVPDAYQGEVHDPMSQKSYMWNRNNPVSYADPSGYCADPGGRGPRACTDLFIAGKDNGTIYPHLQGDNRGFWSQPPHGQSDRYRASIAVNFSEHRATFHIADSHDMSGKDIGAGQDLGSSVVWHGDRSVTVTVLARCGGCPNFGPYIATSITYTKKGDDVSVSGTTTQYPSEETYSYGPNGPNTLSKYTTPYTFGPWGLSVKPIPIPTSPKNK